MIAMTGTSGPGQARLWWRPCRPRCRQRGPV